MNNYGWTENYPQAKRYIKAFKGEEKYSVLEI
jgi:hypothetical protein